MRPLRCEHVCLYVEAVRDAAWVLVPAALPAEEGTVSLPTLGRYVAGNDARAMGAQEVR
jgi:hypothetical protein